MKLAGDKGGRIGVEGAAKARDKSFVPKTRGG